MSRVGRKPIPVPAGVRVEITDGTFVVEGPKYGWPSCRCPAIR